MASIFQLTRKDFMAALPELAQQGVNTDDLLRSYNAQNDATAGLRGSLGAPSQSIADSGRAQTLGGILSYDPSANAGMDRIRSVGFEPRAAAQDAIGGLFGAGQNVYNAMSGRLPTEDLQGAAFDAAGLVAGLGAASAGRGILDYDPNTTRMFLGPSAANANLDALKKARELSARRRSPDEIWSETGWFKGADDKWRFEIPDDKAVLKQPVLNALNYGDYPDYQTSYQTDYSGGVLHQPLLGGSFRGQEYKPAYDFMADMEFANTAQVRGSYDRDTSAIEVSAPSAQEGLPVALHELQHAVQAKEGFAPGSNPDFELSQLLEAQNAKLRGLSAKMDQKKSELGLSGYQPKHPELDPLYAEYDGILAARAGITKGDAYQQYIRTAGEVESNNVMNRRRMTADERAATPPWLTQDFPYGEQIVRDRPGALTQGLLSMGAQ